MQSIELNQASWEIWSFTIDTWIGILYFHFYIKNGANLLNIEGYSGYAVRPSSKLSVKPAALDLRPFLKRACLFLVSITSASYHDQRPET